VSLLTIQPVAVTGRPALNIQLEVLEFVAKYQALTNGKTPSARLIAHSLKPRIDTSHRKVLATLNEISEIGWIIRAGDSPKVIREVIITRLGRSMLQRSPDEAVRELGLDPHESISQKEKSA